MSEPSLTYINFTFCELEGKWEQINEEIHSDLDIFEAIENDAKISIRTLFPEETHYYLKKGSKITIKDHVLKFNKSDFSK